MAKREIGIIGLGNMGENIAKKLYRNNYSLVLYDRSLQKSNSLKELMRDAFVANTTRELVSKLRTSNNQVTVWVMVPGGEATNKLISELSQEMSTNDVIIDGSNSNYEDSIINYEKLRRNGIYYLDVGVGGGPNDITKGVSLMVGGDKIAFDMAENVFMSVAGKGLYGHVGGAGSGQKLKGVHNAIFYGIFPVYAEAATLLMKMKEKDANFNITTAFGLLAYSPPITNDILEAIAHVINSKLLNDAPQIKISEMVTQTSAKAEELGIKLNIIDSIFARYSTMTEETRRVYAAAKKIITGH